MSDARSRELERRWRETAAVEDGVAFLTAALREGSVTDATLRLAAHLGEPAAAALVEVSEARDPVDPLPPSLREWVLGIEPFGAEALGRAALAAARVVLPVYTAQVANCERPHRLVRAAESVLVGAPGALDTGRELLASARRQPFTRARYAYAAVAALAACLAEGPHVVAEGLTLEAAEGLRDGLRGTGAEVEVEASEGAWSLIMHRAPGDALQAVRVVVEGRDVSLGAAHTAVTPITAARYAADAADAASDRVWRDVGLTQSNVRAAVRRELLPWALGLSDPLRASLDALEGATHEVRGAGAVADAGP